MTAGDAGCAGLEGIEVRVNSDDDADWEPYDAPLELGPGEYTIDYRATDEKGNVSAVKSATFDVVEVNDTDKPTVAAVVGRRAGRARLLPDAGVGDDHGHRRPHVDRLDRVPRQPGRRVADGDLRRRRAQPPAPGPVRRARLPVPRVPGDRLGGQRLRRRDALVLGGDAVHVRPVGRVRRAARRALAAPHPQRRHADRRRVRADGGRRQALDADARAGARRRRGRARSTSSARTCTRSATRGRSRRSSP